MKSGISILILLFLVISDSYADCMNWTTYTTSDGMASNHVYAIAADPQGNVWFGTDGGGVSRFDGTNWTTYTTSNTVHIIAIESKGSVWGSDTTYSDSLAGNRVHAIANDSQGNTWFGTVGGVSRFDGNEWISYTEKDLLFSWGMGGYPVNAIALDSQGNVWAGGRGISKFDGNKWISYKNTVGEPVSITTIATDSSGNDWVGTYGTGVWKYDGENWIAYTVDNGLISNRIEVVATDTQGNLWVGYGGYGEGVSKFDGTDWTTYTRTKSTGLAYEPLFYVSSIAADTKGNVWFISSGFGPTKFDGFTWETYLQERTFYNLKEFNELFSGVEVVATDTKGNIRIFGYKFRYVYDPNKLARSIRVVATDSQGNVWFGTSGGGVSKFDGTGWTTYTTYEGAPVNVTSITSDTKGNVWFGSWRWTYGGVSKFDGTDWTRYTTEDGLVNNNVYDITIDKEGNLWIGTNGGLSKYDGNNWTNYISKNPLSIAVKAVALNSQGFLWVGMLGMSYGSGETEELIQFDGNDWITLTRQTYFGGQVDVMAIDKVNDHVWVAVRGGRLRKFDGTEWTTYTTADGLIDNSILGLCTCLNYLLYLVV